MVDRFHKLARCVILALLGAGLMFAVLRAFGAVGGSWWYASGPACVATVIFLAFCLYDLLGDYIVRQNADHYAAVQRRKERNK